MPGKSPKTWWYVYMNLWLGGQALWLLWQMTDLDGWRLLVSAVLVVGSVVCLVQIERDRRQRAVLGARVDASADRT